METSLVESRTRNVEGREDGIVNVQRTGEPDREKERTAWVPVGGSKDQGWDGRFSSCPSEPLEPLNLRNVFLKRVADGGRRAVLLFPKPSGGRGGPARGTSREE